MTTYIIQKPVLSILLLMLISLNAFSQDYDGVLDEDVFIKLEYSGCYQGSYCPRFDITISGSGLVIYEGRNDVAKMGVVQKRIDRQKVADLLTQIFQLRFFEREDESSNCPDTVITIDGGNYEESGGVCFASSHGPFTDILVKFGHKSRKVDLEHYFSDDYVEISEAIIETAGVESLIVEKKTSD
ncbi:hypothetical protein GCM10011365_07190 [Marinicella pacifica]|uniref:DUF6438 domain-containing protein n=1 Tax=Marinicella pacifica TaxID=1171543 RepID=A0A917CJP3_9GAMM|nr:DUF6438 domain-containing protein [Marinicella pacifica]GGF88593.1 hypothetical protein GCM10011365_07190 [Marinicella pacifica]